MSVEQKFVKVFGERNTGTRATIRMLAAQPEVRMQAIGESGLRQQAGNADLSQKIEMTYIGKWRKIYRDALRDNEHAEACPTKAWKHSLPEWNEAFVQKQAHVIFCVRNPYSWALSLAKHPYHQQGPRTINTKTFLSQPWLTLARDNMLPLLRSPLELWNGKCAAYLEFVKRDLVPTHVIKFEEFVAAPESEVQRALLSFDVPFTEVRQLPFSTKSKNRTLREIAAFYREESWKDALTEEVVRIINRWIDWDVAAEFGYNQLNPKDFARGAKKITLKN